MVQVYAGYKYPRTSLQRLKPGKLLLRATELYPSMLSSSDSGESPLVEPFYIKPATLIRSAHHLSAYASRMAKHLRFGLGKNVFLFPRHISL